jgi:phosphomannomutase/phosphoglucomutase
MAVSLPAEIFREYDIRGDVERELTPEVFHTLGLAFGTELRERGIARMGVGRDLRTSSAALARAFAHGVLATGVDVDDLGVILTPTLYFCLNALGYPAGAVVTGSHNPANMNGLKVAIGTATLYGEEIQALRRRAEGGRFASGEGRLDMADPVPAYLDDLVHRIRLDRPLRVVVDAGHGTAALFGPRFLRRLGVDVVPLYCDPDPGFPHHFPDPSDPRNMRDLARAVRESGADAGIAFDGDADRLGAVDERGRIVTGDQLMVLFWREVLSRHPGAPAIVEVKSSQTVWEEIERAGGRPFFYRTGHSLIKAKMREVGAVFAGELSGHFFFGDEFYGYDDALYAAGRLLRLAAAPGRSLAALTADVPVRPATPEVRVACDDRVKFDVVRRAAEALARDHEVVTVDGVRARFEGGWGLIRASNTQPVLVLRAEAESVAALEAIERSLSAVLSAFPEVGEVSWPAPEGTGEPA